MGANIDKDSHQETGRLFKPLETALAYFAANKNFSYIDRLGNALNLDAIEAAIYDALRDFTTACSPGRPIEVREDEVPCPSIDLSQLEQAVKAFLAAVKSPKRTQKGEHLRMARELAINALAASLTLRRQRTDASTGFSESGAEEGGVGAGV